MTSSLDALAFQALGEFGEHVDGGDVDGEGGLGIQHHHPGTRLGGVGADALPDRVGVGEEQPLSTRKITMPGNCWLSGWRSRSPYWPVVPGTLPSTAMWGWEAR